MTTGRFLKHIAVVLGSIVLLGILYLFVADFRWLQPRIETAVQEVTGRDLRVNGEFRLRILPSPSVWVEDATLSNVSWGSEPQMVEVGHFSVKLGFWSLLFRPIIVKDLQLHDVEVLLETAADGDTNWNIGAPVDAEPAQGHDSDGSDDSDVVKWPGDLRALGISNLTLGDRRPASEDSVFTIETWTVETVEDRVRALDGKGDWAGIPFALAGHAAFRGNTVELSNVVARLGAARVTLNGLLDGSNGTAQLSAGTEGESIRMLVPGLPAIPYSGAAEVAIAAGTVTVDPFEFRLGDSDISGRLDLESGDRTSITLEARSALIDLLPFSAAAEESNSDPETAAAKGEPDDRYVFRDEPLPIDALRRFEAQIGIESERIRTAGGELRDFRLQVAAEDGQLAFDAGYGGEHGGTFETHLDIAATGYQLDMEISANASGFKLGALSGPDMPKEQIPASGIDVSIRANGATPRALAASTSGRILFTAGEGLVKNNLVGKLSGDLIARLFAALNPFAKEDEFSNWECSVLAVDFDSGLGDITGFLLQSEKLMIVGGGKIDLNSERFDLEFNTKPRQGVGISADMFVTPFVKLTGTFANPSIGLNQMGVLLSGGAAILTGGMSFLYQGLVDRATAEGGRCEQALEAVGVLTGSNED